MAIVHLAKIYIDIGNRKDYSLKRGGGMENKIETMGEKLKRIQKEILDEEIIKSRKTKTEKLTDEEIKKRDRDIQIFLAAIDYRQT
jgi:hypothetical protein